MSGNKERPKEGLDRYNTRDAEREFERLIGEKISQNMRQIYTTRVGRDTGLTGTFNQIPPPPELIYARVWLLNRERNARAPALKQTIRSLIVIIDQELSLYRRNPIYVGEIFE